MNVKARLTTVGRAALMLATTASALCAAVFFTPAASAGELPAGADRIGVLTNGTLSVKEGNLYASWVPELSGVAKFEIAGDRIGALTTDGVLHVKEGNLWAGWTDQIGGVQDFRLTGDRIGVLRTDGTVAVKEGNLWAGWTEQMNNARELELAGNRIGVLRTDGTVTVKEGNLWAGWVEQTGDVRDLELTADRIGVLRTDNTLAVKEGDLYAPWLEETNGVTQFDLADDRIGVVLADGTVTVKAGNLYASWVNQMGAAAEVRLAGNRIGVLRTDGTVTVKEGNLYDSWVEQIGGVSALRLAAPPSAPPSNPEPVPGAQVTLADLRAIYGYLGDEATISAGLPGLNTEMGNAGITSPARKAAFLATLRNESGFRYNAGEAGSSATYRGRGFIQITNDFNYRAAGDYFGQNFLANPDALATLQWSAPAARWYWTVARNINYFADRLDMGGVDGAIGYAYDSREDTERCDDFKKALRYYSGGTLPAGINCTRH
ncbi:MAG TPA: glycoside hydrolase family 19 protein [Actinophytocola sp.]|jgi:predicted chitinase|uniref:glycoside hydrolase family 19 protein n=1 Tax=Actinophytocola sp. TaxID=1872138 RepID=UPI002E0C55AE|nr:glycoside hydrolase family 19 protein [Actinophytocola sp.]